MNNSGGGSCAHRRIFHRVYYGKQGINSISAKNIAVNAANKNRQKAINATALHGKIKYSSDNKNITVSSSGVVTIKKNYAGKARITMTAAQTYYKTATKTITVTVKKAKPVITASNKTISASAKKRTLSIGAKTTGGKLSYTSSRKEIIVNSSGKVTVKAKFVGTGTITVKATGGQAFYNASKKIKITVSKQKPVIKASNKKYYVNKANKTYPLNATCNISGKLEYKSNNKNITVNSAGKVTVKKNYEGKATITISMKGTVIRKAATKKITVTLTKRANPISASSIVTYYAAGKKKLDIGASVKEKTKLTYASDNPYIKVSKTGTLSIAAGYVGKATITIKAAGNTYYKGASKKITVTVKDSGSGGGNSTSEKLENSITLNPEAYNNTCFVKYDASGNEPILRIKKKNDVFNSLTVKS